MLKREITATLASNVFGAGMSLFSFIILNRTLQEQGRGLLALALLIPHTAAMFCNLGLGTVNSTYAGLHKEKRIQLFQQSLLITVFSGAFTSMLLFAFFFWLPIPKGKFGDLGADLIYLSFIVAPTQTLAANLTSLMRGVGRITTAAKLRVFQSISLVTFLALFLWWLRLGVKAALLIVTAEQLIAVLVSFWVLRDYISFRTSHFSARFFQKSLSFGLKCSMATLAGYLVYRIDQMILAYMVSAYQIGFYVVAVSLAERLKLLPNSISLAFLPRLANELETRETQVPKVFRCTVIISFMSMFLVGILGIPLILISGKSFINSIPSFLLLLPGIAVLGGSGILGSYLASHNKPKYGIWTGWTTLAVNVALNLAWIPLMGIAGAALASTVSYACAGVLWLLFYRKESQTPLSDLVPTKEDFRYLWQQFIFLIQKVLKRLTKNRSGDVVETEEG